MSNEQITLEKFDKLVMMGKATWWQMELPSGNVIFGGAKAEMLGYPESDFKRYQDFTNLLHKDDYERVMQAMRDHLEGKTQFYETFYRIKHRDGHYVGFYDCGQVVKRDGESVTVMGFVIRVDEKEQGIYNKMNEFKDLITKGSPSMIDLIKKMK